MIASPVTEQLILLTGATGYVGGRLLKHLERSGRRVRCLARRPEALRSRVAGSTEVVQADVLDADLLRTAMQGVHTAYYLVHSMALGKRFHERDHQAATTFAREAKRAGVRRIIYLGGLGSGPSLSAHLSSRQQVGRILRQSGVPTIEFRASIIIGPGSLSFEMIRALVGRLPVMVTPRWVRTLAQPIAIEDVIKYLAAALDLPPEGSAVFEIGGPDCASYLDIMKEYARQRRLRRVMIPVPVLTPRLSSLWLMLVTPLQARVGRQLIESIRNETLVTDDRAASAFAIRPCSMREAIKRALETETAQSAGTRWSAALLLRGVRRRRPGSKFAARLVASRSVAVHVPAAQAFRPIQEIGGQRGWYYADWLWQLRGWIDRAVSGVGMRRGRPDPRLVAPGDPIDFWRVEAFEPDRLLRLVAEMKLPGRGWLQFEAHPKGQQATIRQTAIFEVRGAAGLVYWYALYLVHGLVFAGMLRGIARAAQADRNAVPPAN